jgi:KaiC/GvpD/RAD55 family RecA-like ATPase
MTQLKRTPHRPAVVELSTGIPALDCILGGGIIPTGQSTPSIVVKGVPGSGKSIFCITMATAALKSGFSTVYVSLDQVAKDIQAIAASFRWGPRNVDRDVQIVNAEWNGEQKTINANVDDGQLEPHIRISHFPLNLLKAAACTNFLRAEAKPNHELRSTSFYDLYCTLSDFDAKLQAHVRMECLRAPKCKLIVIDALSDVFRHNGDDDTVSYHVKRGLFQSFCELGGDIGAVVVTVLEKERDDDWRNYVADMVIDFGWADRSGGSRYVNIEKARGTHLLNGPHEMRIDAIEGIRVFPAHKAFLRVAPVKKPHGSRGKVPFCASDGFKAFLADDLIEGSSCLLFGTDATRKNILATRFLEFDITSKRNNSGALFVAAGLTEAVARDMVQQYLYCEPGNVSDEEIEERLNRIFVISTSPNRESFDELFDRIRQVVEGNEISRAVVCDLGSFERCFEILPLKEYFEVCGVTSLFVHTVGDGQYSPVRESFDSVIRSRYLTLPNGASQRVGYRVMKLNGTSRGVNRYWELTYDVSSRLLKIDDAFQEYDEGGNGRLVALPLRISCHCEEASAQKEWLDQLRAVFGIRGSNNHRRKEAELIIDVFVRSEAEKVLEELLLLDPSYDLGESRVSDLDEYWLNELVANDKLLPLEAFVTNEFQQQFHSKAFGRGVTVGPDGIRHTYAVPHHISCGFYVVRRDLVTEELARRNGASLDKPLSWEQLLAIGNQAMRGYREKSMGKLIGHYRGDEKLIEENEPAPISVFDCHGDLRENLVCCVLEVIWPWLFRDGEFRGFSDSCVISAVQTWYSCLQSAGALPLLGARSPEPAVFQRVWINDYWKLNRPDKCNGNLRIIPSPTLAVSAHGPGFEAKSICGEWFLGILRGSANLERGFNAIRTLTIKPFNRRVLRQQIGLPANANMFQSPEVRQLMKTYDVSVSRRDVPNYYDLRPGLIQVFSEIFGSSDVAPGGIADSLRKLDE